jgi:hypothetical protein
MDIKEMIVRIRLLANDILDYSMGSYFGIQADNRDVRKLWQEYDDLRNQFKGDFSDLKDDFKEVPIPEPYIADNDSFYMEGTRIFKPEHFTSIRIAVEKMLQSVMTKNHGQRLGSSVTPVN